ncbi:hypothetical protein FS837_000445 [Tulasnella sp. UAMH 9824]|nr:hypothetical protein FS837_000445 [Tulasnella sp. UAMH 9824]
MDVTQDPLDLASGMQHYLKILIGIALTSALKLEREHSSGDALLKFFDRLQCLEMDGANPNANRKQHIVLFSALKLLCERYRKARQEDCVRLGTFQRWHSHCIKCVICGKVAAVAPSKGEDKAAAAEANANCTSSENENEKPSKVSSARRPPANVDDFRYEQLVVKTRSSSDKIPQPKVVIYCGAPARRIAAAGSAQSLAWSNMRSS